MRNECPKYSQLYEGSTTRPIPPISHHWISPSNKPKDTKRTQRLEKMGRSRKESWTEEGNNKEQKREKRESWRWRDNLTSGRMRLSPPQPYFSGTSILLAA